MPRKVKAKPNVDLTKLRPWEDYCPECKEDSVGNMRYHHKRHYCGECGGTISRNELGAWLQEWKLKRGSNRKVAPPAKVLTTAKEDN